MGQMKVSNEEIVAYANNRIRAIQRNRHQMEIEDLERLYTDFNIYYTKKWVFSRNFGDWFKFFGPFALIGLLFYPISILIRYFVLQGKPITANPVEMAEWIYDTEDSWWCDTYALESGVQGEAMSTCLKLKCMAKNNEDGYLLISREEAEFLGIC